MRTRRDKCDAIDSSPPLRSLPPRPWHNNPTRILATPYRELVPLRHLWQSQRISGPLAPLLHHHIPSLTHPHPPSPNPLPASYAFDTKGSLTREQISGSNRCVLTVLLSLPSQNDFFSPLSRASDTTFNVNICAFYCILGPRRPSARRKRIHQCNLGKLLVIPALTPGAHSSGHPNDVLLLSTFAPH